MVLLTNQYFESDGSLKTVSIKKHSNKIRKIWFRGDLLFIAYSNLVTCIDPQNGTSLGTSPLGVSYRHWNGQFLQDERGRIHVVDWNGSGLRFEPVPHVRPDTIALFDRVGVDGPWGIISDGEVYSTTWESPKRHMQNLDSGIRRPVELLGVSQDGHRIALRGPHRMTHLIGHLERGTWVESLGNPLEDLEMGPGRLHTRPSFQNSPIRIHRIGITSDCELTLITVSSQSFIYRVSDEGILSMVLAKRDPSPPESTRLFDLRPRSGQRGTRFSLREARFEEGTRVLIDGRGLVHIISSDESLDQVTLTLGLGPVAGYCVGTSRRGAVFGPAFHEGTETRIKTADAASLLGRILRRARC